MMMFIRQIKFEAKNILRSRFLLILGCILVAAGILIPVINFLSARRDGNQVPTDIYPMRDEYAAGQSASGISIDKPGTIGGDTITINGVTIGSDNPYYGNLYQLQQEKGQLENGQIQMSHPEAVDVMLALNSDETDYYLRFAQKVTNWQDYRAELAWNGVESLYDRFIFEKDAMNVDVYMEVFTLRKGGVDPTTFNEKYVNITATQRLAGLQKAEDYLDMIFEIVDQDNFEVYVDYKIKQANDQIVSLQDNIAVQVEAISKNPALEESLGQVIKDLENQIKVIEESTIPVLQYRLTKNIRPGANVWQNNALNDIESSRSQLAYTTIMTEEEFNKNGGNDGGGPIYYKDYGYYYGQYENYQEYVAAMTLQIDNLNKTIIIAQKSLDTDKPDMKYVPAGSRAQTNDFLDYGIYVALFGVLLGGWLIASEFQQGTIRLLMIRPRTRLKILFAKFIAAILILFVIDIAGSLVNAAANGVLFGFADFANPNYTVSGSIGFAGYLLPRFLACFLPAVFSFAAAFLLSVVLRNTAVAIVLPIALFIASLITTQILVYSVNLAWLAYTPLPYMMLPTLLKNSSMLEYALQNGIHISLTYGIVLLLALSVVFAALAAIVFKRRDITN